MADVRSLLRQQRASRRIEHPHAAYTDAGKLLCTLCREQIRAESLWDSHVQSEAHARRLQSPPEANGPLRSDTGGVKQKRKLDDADGEVQDAIRRKRSRADLALTPTNGANKGPERTLSSGSGSGIELQIPSRPATPSRRDVSASTTPGIAPPAFPQGSASNVFLTPRPVGNPVSAAGAAQASSAAPQVDESEWAAFEADMAAESVSYDDAVISAPAMTAEESAAAKASAENNNESRRAQADVDIEEEREEATRAIEDEFQDMHELEARVRRLKDKREALRRQNESRGQEAAPEKPSDPGREVNGEEGEEDDDSDDNDDWDGFRFRAS
ncbi:transcription factor Zn, C2H2 [Hirsutella rhossiliensis]|uniref:Transcription factor Zn, C2H2 n=1 Tax=Hirsutella rhossiliensis TaxID=111463 RepID=A0A9P8MNZ7_9HYPO|nr:transcription factor Zn, C2H2 [Hirsutella rhossiliensis]KAH0958545.1 transcription factor Zn, C2H2 [Hirsutella rhossiliensis]